jgi:hypothetical protein
LVQQLVESTDLLWVELLVAPMVDQMDKTKVADLGYLMGLKLE